MSVQTHRAAHPAAAAVMARQAPSADGALTAPPTAPIALTAPDAPGAPVALGPVPPGGGRLIVDRQGDRTVFTSVAMPPEVLSLAQTAEETAIGLVGLLAAIIILGPFARMFARRMDRHTEIKAVGENARVLQHQLQQLQQSMDAMSVEVERIGESQRFQSKLLYEKPRV